MDKKPLIGVSILVVVLLVFISLSNVVGYQSVQSTVVNDSPLFITRTQRATNQQQNILTSQYLGMGKDTLLKFPIRDNKTESLIKVFEYINKMDEQSYAQFTNLFVIKIHQNPAFDNTNDEDIKKMLQLFRDEPSRFNLYAQNHVIVQQTLDYPLFSICPWFPGCLPLIIYGLIYYMVFNLIYYSGLIISLIVLLIKNMISSFLTLDECITVWAPCPD